MITKTKFDAFLKRHRAWKAFYRNVKMNGYHEADVRGMLRTNPEQALRSFFIWGKTPEYQRIMSYWKDLDTMWQLDIQKHRRREVPA
jgi:hypothetical protein